MDWLWTSSYQARSQALKMDQTLYDVRNEFHIGATETFLPQRTEWKWGDFPLGEYEFDVHIDGEIFPFKWQRGDSLFNTLNLVCLDREIGSDVQRQLKDSEKFLSLRILAVPLGIIPGATNSARRFSLKNKIT